MKSTLLFFLIFIIVLGCSTEERPSYESMENILPSGGVIIYDPDSSFMNIPEVQEGLTEQQKAVFASSLSWYGTESEYGLDKLEGKTAKQLVDIVNCLKTSAPQEQEYCF